jgi:transposase-like protein
MQDDDIDEAVYDFKQIHFAINRGNKRTTVMLEGYLVKALQRKHGLTHNRAIRAWIEQAIKNDGARFDSDAPLTKQVKRLIIESLV